MDRQARWTRLFIYALNDRISWDIGTADIDHYDIWGDIVPLDLATPEFLRELNEPLFDEVNLILPQQYGDDTNTKTFRLSDPEGISYHQLLAAVYEHYQQPINQNEYYYLTQRHPDQYEMDEYYDGMRLVEVVEPDTLFDGFSVVSSRPVFSLRLNLHA